MKGPGHSDKYLSAIIFHPSGLWNVQSSCKPRPYPRCHRVAQVLECLVRGRTVCHATGKLVYLNDVIPVIVAIH